VKKLVVFIGLMAILLCLSQARAEENDKRFALSFGFGQTVPTNPALKELAGGSAKSTIVGFGYRFGKTSYSTFNLVVQIMGLPLRGNEWIFVSDPNGMQRSHYADWDWTAAVLYVKMNVGKGSLTPFVEMGGGVYHLSVEYPFPQFFEQNGQWYFQWEIRNIAETYPGFIAGAGLQLTLGELSILGGIEYNVISMKPALQLPLASPVSQANIINYKLSLAIAF